MSSDKPRYSLCIIALPPLEAFLLYNMNRVTFYFDGFNFYNGLKERASELPAWKNYYWIDFVKLCEQFTQEGQLISVKYFTAPPSNDGQRSRQSALFSANKLLNPGKFSQINGNYQNKTIECKKCKKRFEHPEEKRTDVNIAVSMMLDCFHDHTDTLVLISADSDQVPTIQAIQSNFPNKKIKVYFPPNRKSAELLAVLKQVVYLENNEDKFKASVMPGKIELSGKIYTRPIEWRY
jgi:uncharacterized LabA/DUF88 family protein